MCLTAARERYPARGTAYEGTTLCIDHRCRIRVNEECNRRLARPGHVFIKAGDPIRGCANLPQDMRVWPGIILTALGTSEPLRNGLRYQVLELPNGNTLFNVQQINDDGMLLGMPFKLETTRVAMHCDSPMRSATSHRRPERSRGI